MIGYKPKIDESSKRYVHHMMLYECHDEVRVLTSVLGIQGVPLQNLKVEKINHCILFNIVNGKIMHLGHTLFINFQKNYALKHFEQKT